MLSMVVVAAAGCAVDADDPSMIVDRIDSQQPLSEVSDQLSADVRAPDVCALAAALPEGDICRNVCDPPAMAAQLVAEGSDKGYCYQLSCQLSESEHVLVGVCLPP